MRVEKIKQEKTDSLEQEIVEVFLNYRDVENLSWAEALNATSRLMNLTVDEVEDILIKNRIYEVEDKKRSPITEQSDVLDKVMKKVGSGKELTDEEEKALKAALNAAKKGESGDKEMADKIMKKVRDGKELSTEEEKMLSAIIDASKESKEKGESMKKEKKDILVLTEDVTIEQEGEENIILEKGDRIEILNEKKKALKEDHFLRDLGPEFSAVLTDAYSKGVDYVAKDLARFFDYFADDWSDVDRDMQDLLASLASIARKFYM